MSDSSKLELITHLYGDALEDTIKFLNSEQALEMLKKDVYWPKWNSPWWHASLLYEMGLSRLIPDSVIQVIIDEMNRTYPRFFPIEDHEIQEVKQLYNKFPCHCQIGNIYQILRSKRDNIDEVMPWLRTWLSTYQLPDGGLNCESEAYKNSMKSSISSSLPVFEALMLCAETTGLTPQEDDFIDKAAAYVINHRLIHKTNGEIINPEHLLFQFPRFYYYDFMRGLQFLVRWKRYRNTNLADEVIAYGMTILKEKLKANAFVLEFSDFMTLKTKAYDEPGTLTKVSLTTGFPLLEAVNRVGHSSIFLKYIYEDLVNQVL